jgi:hypothetical protein
MPPANANWQQHIVHHMDYARASADVRRYNVCVIYGAFKVDGAIPEADGEVGFRNVWEGGCPLQAVTQLCAEDGTAGNKMVGQ